MRLTVSIKIALSIAAAVAAAGALLLTIEIRADERERRAEFRAATTEALQLLALAVAPAVAEGRHDRVQAVLDNVANYPDRFPDIEAVEVLDRTGRVLADLDPRRFGLVRADEAARRDLSARSSVTRQIGSDRLEVTVPVRLASWLGVLRATASEKRLRQGLAIQRRQAAGVGLAGVLVLAAMLYFVHARLVGARIARLAQTASLLRRGRMDARAPVRGRDEIAQLAEAFNQMAADLAAYTAQLESLVEERTAELRSSYAQLEQLAVTDALTGLFNRRHFEQRAGRDIEVARRAGQAFSLVVLDVDHFKSINDRFGHPVGDVVLRRVAEVLAQAARAADLVARVGGEEFAIAMPNTAPDEAAVGAERIRAALASAEHPDASAMAGERVTASVGIATFPEDGGTLEALFVAADRALYAAKRRGRNCVVLASSLEHDALVHEEAT